MNAAGGKLMKKGKEVDKIVRIKKLELAKQDSIIWEQEKIQI